MLVFAGARQFIDLDRLKIPWAQARVGSSPTSGTLKPAENGFWVVFSRTIRADHPFRMFAGKGDILIVMMDVVGGQ